MHREDGLPEEILPSIFREGVQVAGNYQPARSSFYQTPEQATQLAEFIRSSNQDYLNREKPIGDMPIMHYALWNLLDWREPHNTPAAAKRFQKKLSEELIETVEAIENHQQKEALSEYGDLLFCVTAAANIMGIDSERGVAIELLETYGRTNRFPTITDVDKEVAGGIIRRDKLYPNGQYPFLAWNLYTHEDIPEWDLRSPEVLKILIQNIYFALDPIAAADIKIDGPGSPHPEVLEKFIGKTWLFIAFYAQTECQSSLEGVVEHNLRKIASRVGEGTLDDKINRTI